MSLPRSKFRRLALAALLLALSVASPWTAGAADHTHGPTSPSASFGTIDFENSCAPAVQTDFRTAIAMLHSFAADEKQFADVAARDPSCAIAWWGAAMAARGNPLAGDLDGDTLRLGRQYLARTKGLKTTPRERSYLDAMEIYYREYPDGGQLARTRAYEASMERLARDHPEDVEAEAFHGLAATEAIDLNSRNYDQQRKAGRILEALLARRPDHPGGLHYLIHAYDFAPLAQLGLPAARRYAAVAPASYHARHMPAHIFTMLGLWDESIKANRDSNAVVEPAQAGDPVLGDIAYFHTLDFIVYARLQLAQDRWVAADLNAAAKAKKSAALLKARYALERGDWTAATEIALANNGGFDDVTGRFARALGAARLQKAETARTELHGLRSMRAGIERTSGAYWAGFVDIYVAAVEGWIARADGQTEAGLNRMRAAADLDDAREKNIRMENKLLPMRELLGEFLLEIGRPAPAFLEFAKSLEHAPNRYRSLLGGARAAAAAGDAAMARDYYAKLIDLTATADSRSREIAEARTYLER